MLVKEKKTDSERRIQRDPSYDMLKDEVYGRSLNYLDVLERPFKETEDGKYEVPFSLNKKKITFKDENIGAVWASSDYLTKILNDNQHESKPVEAITQEVEITALSIRKGLK
jgi:hypothetical protein